MFCPMTDARPPAKYKVGLVQMAMSADLDENLKHAIDRVEEAARQGARLVCLPELFRSRYPLPLSRTSTPSRSAP